LINFGLIPYSFVLGQILPPSLYPCCVWTRFKEP